MRRSPDDATARRVAAAREGIALPGIDGLSLRDVARRLGVSHQAPYKHYPSRDDLLAEVTRRCFQQFAQHLEGRKMDGVVRGLAGARPTQPA
jgi:AcrR family transcriptional regulator